MSHRGHYWWLKIGLGVFQVAPRASANGLTVVAANVLQRQMSVAEHAMVGPPVETVSTGGI